MTQLPPPAQVMDLLQQRPVNDGNLSTWTARARSFAVAWTATAAASPDAIITEADEEFLLLLPDVGAELTTADGVVHADRRTVVVMPPKESRVTLDGPGRAIRILAPVPPRFAAAPQLNIDPSPVRGVEPRFQRRDPASSGPAVHRLDLLPNSPGMPRAKLFQSATLSINWVEYNGPRDRGRLSPHAHADFEQGSLALEGDFVHHLRTPWSSNAHTWRDDVHPHCAAGSLAVIPPTLIHTTEGIGPMRHILIDIFAPPRRDFIARGQVLNAADYLDNAR